MRADLDVLQDFAANEVGWAQVERRFASAIAQQIERAALAETPDKHAAERGILLGFQRALGIIQDCRRELTKEPIHG